jgi:hypothetical protein
MNNSSAWIRQLESVQPVDGLDISGSAKHDALLQRFTLLLRCKQFYFHKICKQNKYFAFYDRHLYRPGILLVIVYKSV